MTETQNGQQAQSTLEAYQGRQHLLLIFAPAENDPLYQEQFQLLDGNTEACNARDIVIGRLFADGESNLGGTQSASPLPLELRQEFDIAEDEFALLLVGKDGEIKLRTNQPTPLDKVFEMAN